MWRKRKRWYRLDNASRIYTNVISSRVTSVFRLSATLSEKIDCQRLQQAVDNLMVRLPFYRVQLKSGIFWQFLEQNENLPVVREEIGSPCQRPDKKHDRGFLFRILYFNRRISVECSHILTDGGGAMVFLQALLVEYFRISGIICQNTPEIPASEDKPSPKEFEEAYRRFYDSKLPNVQPKSRAYHLNEPLEKPGIYNVVTGIVPVKELLTRAKEHQVSLTEYLTAVLMFAIQKYAQKRRLPLRPVRILVPVNLRKIFNSRTMRNFFLPVEPEIDLRLGEYEFEEILHVVHHYMRMSVDKKLIAKQIRRNVATERHVLIKFLPLFVKHIIGPIIYNLFGTSGVTTMVTNLGRFQLPEEIAGKVERVDFLPNTNPHEQTSMAVISYGDKAYLSFGSQIANREIEAEFFGFLRKAGVPVKIETND